MLFYVTSLVRCYVNLAFIVVVVCFDFKKERDVTVPARCILVAEAWTEFVHMCPAQAATFVGLE